MTDRGQKNSADLSRVNYCFCITRLLFNSQRSYYYAQLANCFI